MAPSRKPVTSAKTFQAVVLAIAALSMTGSSLSAQSLADNWRFETVVSGPAKPTLALAGDGTPHITFMAEDLDGFVGHAVWNAIEHRFDVTEIIRGYFYGPAAIDVDAEGHPHISYHDHTTQDQQHLFLSDQGWINEQIESAGHDGWDNSIVVDPSGIVHTSSIDPDVVGVEYAKSSPSGWLVQSIGSAGVGYGFATSLALDPDGAPHISYFDNLSGNLMVARQTRPWAITAVDTSGVAGRFASLRIDAERRMHVAYLRDLGESGGLVEYAWSDGGDWILAGTVDTLRDVSRKHARRMIALDVDDAGNPHVTYGDRTVVKYAYLARGRWTHETVVDMEDSGRVLGQLTSMELDPSGVAHLTYYEVVRPSPVVGEITYARRDLPAAVGTGGEDPSPLALRFSVYPNPTLSTSSIAFTLDRPAEVLVSVYDLQGRRLEILADAPMTAGRHRLSFGRGLHANGLYLVTLEMEGRRATQKLVILR